MGTHEGHEGQIFGSYRLLRFLGRGGFGTVYFAEHIYLNTPAAVKLLAPERDQDIRDLIRAEAHISARLEHQHIARILDFGIAGDLPYLVMTYAPFGTLRTLHPRGTVLSSQRVAFYVRQLAQALQYAHEHKVVHRDVKPENMLLGEKNQVLLSDFGIAVAAHRTHSLSTQEAMGTTAYMAPEQAEGKARAASDQYSLGVVVYEWLTGSLPFTGRSTIELALKHQREQPPSLRKKKATISPQLEQVVMKALAKDPRERFASVRAFAEAFEVACADEVPTLQGSTLLTYGGHVGYVNTLAWSPDGQWIASGAEDGTIQVWSAATGDLCTTYLGHKGSVYSLYWSPDGAQLVSGSEDHTAHVWDAATGKLRLIYRGHSDDIDAVAWSPDGTRIASGSIDRTVQIWDAATGTHHLTYRGHEEFQPEAYVIHAVSWSPSGFYLASASEDGTAQVWDAATGKQLQMFHDQKGHMETVAWVRNGSALLTKGDWTVQIWDPLSGERRLTYTPPQKTIVTGAAPSPNGQYIASSDGGKVIRIWQADTGEERFIYRGHSDWASVIAWSPDCTRIASVSKSEVYVWQAMP